MSDNSQENIETPKSGPMKQEHGAQVHLTGNARAAARGALHSSIHENTMARDAEIAAGHAGSGATLDGSTEDGRLPPDVAEGADQAEYGELRHTETDPVEKKD